MPPSKLHLHKNKESNQKILHNNSTDNPVIYNHHNDNIDSIRITPKTTQLYYPLKHCKIINTNNDNDDLLHITNLKQQPQQQHNKINGHIKSPLQVPVTKLPKHHTYKQIKLIDDKFQEEKSNSNISTIKDSNTTIKQFESNVSLQSYKDTSPNLSSSSMKQDLQYLKPSILNGQYSSQVQLNNNHISSHNLLDKSNVNQSIINNNNITSQYRGTYPVRSLLIKNNSNTTTNNKVNTTHNNNNQHSLIPVFQKNLISSSHTRTTTSTAIVNTSNPVYSGLSLKKNYLISHLNEYRRQSNECTSFKETDITRKYLNDTKSASISDLSHSSLRINHKTLNNKSIKDSPLLSKSSIFITTESNSLNDVSFTSDNLNNSIHQHPKITIIREDVNNRKMNSYPKLPITQQSTYRKDIPLDQSPLSNVSYESLPNVSSTSSKLHSSIIQMNNQHHHSNSALHNEVNHVTWKLSNTIDENNLNDKVEMDISNSDKVMHFTNTSYINSNKINSIKQYEQYKSTPNINISMKKTKPLKLLSKVNETYVTHIARPLKPEFSNDNLKHFNTSSEQDLLFNRKMKSNTNETNRRFSSELDTLKQYNNEGLLNSYDHYLNKQMNIKKLNETVNNVQLSTCRHRSYEQNLNKNGDVNLLNGHIVQPIVVQRQYASNNFVSSKPLNTQLSENYTNHSDYNPIKNLHSEFMPNNSKSLYPSEESLSNNTKLMNGYNNNNSTADYCNYLQSLRHNENSMNNNYNEMKISGIYRKINQKQPTRMLPRRPRSLIQDNNNNNNQNNHCDLHKLSNELCNNNGHSYDNLYNNSIDNELCHCNASIDIRSITPNTFHKYDSCCLHSYNSTTSDNISIITDDYNSYDYRCSNEIPSKTRTWTYRDLHTDFHPDSYIANKHKSNSTYNGVYHRSNDLIHFHHSPTEYNLHEINNGTNSISLNSPNNNNNNSQSLKPLSIKIHQQSTDKHHIHLQQTKQPTELDNNSTSDICSTSSSLSDHTTNGRNCTCQIHSYSLPYNGGIKQMMNNDIDNVCIKHRTLPLIPNKYEHNQQIQQHSSRTLTSSQLTTPMVSWRIKDSKEYYYNKKLLRLIEHLPEDKQNSIGLILLSMDVKLFNDNKSLNHQINNVNYSDIFCGGLEYRLREALQLVQPKNKIMNNDFDQRFNTTNHTTDKNNINMELNKSCLNKIIDARSRKNFNESTKTSTNFSKEYPKEDGRESGIDPDTLDETSISIMGNSLSLNDMKYTTNGCSNTNELTKPNVITVLKRLARYLALRIANKRHSLATANQHVARNAIEEKLLRSRLSELNIDKGYGDSLMNSWNSLQSIELNRGTIVNRFDRWHNNTIAVIQLLCQLARRLAILDGQLYYYNKKKFYDNVILLCKQEINSNNNTNTTNNSSNDYYLLTSLSYTHLTPSSTIKPSMISNSLFNDFNSVNNQCESSQIIEQQKQLITQIKEAQLLRNELETCRRRLLESIPANLKCDLTHTILGKLGRDFIDNDKLNKLSTSSNTINNSNNHDMHKSKLSTCANQQQQVSERQRITLEETSDIEVNEDKIDCQQINTTTSTTTTSSQFLRQRVAEHLIEFLNWFVLSQIFETEIKVDQDLWESIQDELRFELSY